MDEFREIVWGYYLQNQRDLPWRLEPYDAYRILVSELMLQQTQVSRVIPKYKEFLSAFPDIYALANASLIDVLRLWSGLGYNRRAKYLHDAVKQLQFKLTWTVEDLVACKGIGKNTAAAVIVYSYDQPMVFIETNIRTVYIHHFFNDTADIDDRQLIPLIEQSLDREHPREFYYALMDYGTYLKKSVGNISRQSKHYTKQSSFVGSKRQIRGEVLRQLSQATKTVAELKITISDQRLEHVLHDLILDGLIVADNSKYSLAP